MSQSPKGLDLRKVIGLELTLAEYEAELLDGRAYYDSEPLEFECTQCGACCTRAGVVFLTPDDLERIAAHFDVTVPEAVRAWFDGEDDPVITVDDDLGCPFYQDEKCTIHEVKPIQCATYPFWPEVVGTPEAWWVEAAECEGIGRGRKYHAEEVRRLLLGVLMRTDAAK